MNEKIIYKWGPLNFGPTTFSGSVVHVGWQENHVYVWTENQIVPGFRHPERMARLHPTGQKYTGAYLGSVIAPSGLVWHVIEEER